jgi:enoyl-CoA hydratase
MEYLLTSNMIDAQEANRLGLVNAVVEAGQEVAAAKEMLLKIGEKAPMAVTKSIEAMNAFYDENQNGYEVEYKSFGVICETEDFIEGAQAFVEKRKATFKGK